MASLAVCSTSTAARPAVTLRRRRLAVVCQAGPNKTEEKRGPLGLGDLLGPIGLSVGKDTPLEEVKPKKASMGAAQMAERAADAAGISLGPIGLTIGSDLASTSRDEGDGSSDEASSRPQSIASLTTDEWRELYEREGRVDLWVKEEFNSGSRLVGGSNVHNGGVAGFGSGEGPGKGGAAVHKVKIMNNYTGEESEVEVPEDRYILFAAEEQGFELPFACRLGCCTACTVKVKEGSMYQPHSLGLSKGLRDLGYGLMCVGYPLSDLVLETVPEDEAYELQFGKVFAEIGSDPNGPSVERDDFAIELAMLDE